MPQSLHPHSTSTYLQESQYHLAPVPFRCSLIAFTTIKWTPPTFYTPWIFVVLCIGSNGTKKLYIVVMNWYYYWYWRAVSYLAFFCLGDSFCRCHFLVGSLRISLLLSLVSSILGVSHLDGCTCQHLELRLVCDCSRGGSACLLPTTSRPSSRAYLMGAKIFFHQDRVLQGLHRDSASHGDQHGRHR